MTLSASRRWHPGHAIVAGLGLLCVLLLVRLATSERPQAVPMPIVAPPAMADAALLTSRDLFFGAGSATGDALPVTDLPFSLHGLRTDSSTGRGSAIIAGADGVQNSHAVGDSLGDGVVLVAIAFDHVVLERDGRREALWLDSSGSTPLQSYEPTELAMTDAMAAPSAVEPPATPPTRGSDESSGAAEMPAAPPDPESSAP